ncbi:hypothetical protein HPG27_1332 [Helicobacter pylori G27]|uniref:Uncharacterized protein n=1 Tax=Helicobacter pylori (strain G27) TaxID=563041 RepID=B5Z801_HELPG|nr:hypothetical protein HPG27_946 [Helicobacter pylori G27]ACI28080.1 hypothetical protein HPG27_1332 [Helicobacter pylori G27]
MRFNLMMMCFNLNLMMRFILIYLKLNLFKALFNLRLYLFKALFHPHSHHFQSFLSIPFKL